MKSAMKSTAVRWLLAVVATLLLAAGCAWLWHALMTKRVIAVPYVSQAWRDNPALAATRLMERHGHPVRVEPTLRGELVRQPPAGTLLVLNGTVDALQAGPLLDWVRRGNTLVVRPGWVAEDGFSRSAENADAIGTRYGVALSARTRQDDTCRQPTVRMPAKPARGTAPSPVTVWGQLACVTPPGYTYPLELARGHEVLQPEERARPLWSDTYGLGVAVFREGRGHVVLLARDYFSHDELRNFDHAELLLVLARLAGPRAPLLIVHAAGAQTWPQALWHGFAPALCAAAALVLLWLWSATRRFGPTLPEPDGARRALVEHVEASGRWLWQVPGGRELLLGAVRGAVTKRLRRRAPELDTLAPEERLRQLAARTGIAARDLDLALHAQPARRAADFAHQISILQRLRVHHER